MIYKTRDFGEVEIETSKIIHFQQPIFGFDEYITYALLQDPEAGEDIAWLQSLDDSTLCFILVSKRLAAPYSPEYPANLEKLVGSGEVNCWLIAVVQEEFIKSTINLKSPILINWQTGFGAQVILEGDYPVRKPLLEEADGAC